MGGAMAKAKMQRGQVKTYNAILGTGYVELVPSGTSLKFDAQAVDADGDPLRSGDAVLVSTVRGRVESLVPNEAELTGEAPPVPDYEASVATVNVHGDTPARFNRSSFARSAARLDFLDQ